MANNQTELSRAQIQILLDAAVNAGDAGVAEHARRALDATQEPWAVRAATLRCTGFVAYARRHEGVTVNEWTLPAELVS